MKEFYHIFARDHSLCFCQLHNEFFVSQCVDIRLSDILDRILVGFRAEHIGAAFSTADGFHHSGLMEPFQRGFQFRLGNITDIQNFIQRHSPILLQSVEYQQRIHRHRFSGALLLLSNERNDMLIRQPSGNKQLYGCWRAFGIVRQIPSKAQRAFKNPIHTPTGTLGKTDSFQGICKHGVSAVGFHIQNVAEGDTFNETAGVADGKTVGIHFQEHSAKTGIVPVGKGINDCLPHCTVIKFRNGDAEQSHFHFTLRVSRGYKVDHLLRRRQQGKEKRFIRRNGRTLHHDKCGFGCGHQLSQTVTLSQQQDSGIGGNQFLSYGDHKLQCLVQIFIWQFQKRLFSIVGTDDFAQAFPFQRVQILISCIGNRLGRKIQQRQLAESGTDLVGIHGNILRGSVRFQSAALQLSVGGSYNRPAPGNMDHQNGLFRWENFQSS